MKIPSIHVGCGKFSLQRLEMLINGNEFNPIACVDIDLEKVALEKIQENAKKYPIEKSLGKSAKYHKL